MEPDYIITIGASAGGTTALTSVLHELPSTIPAALFVTLHLPSQAISVLPAILQRASRLEACQVRHVQPIQPGRIYVAPPRFHMLVNRGQVRLTNDLSDRHRPAINPLFRSAAHAYGKRVIGIVLSGMLDDGSDGLAEIKRFKGLCIVQEPADAMFGEMPRNAISRADPHLCLTTAEIRQFLVALERSKSKTAQAKSVLARHTPPPGSSRLSVAKKNSKGSN